MSNLGIALASGLGGALTKSVELEQARELAKEREEGLLGRLLAKQQLSAAPSVASGKSRASGSRASAPGLDLIESGVLTPEQYRASIVGQVGTAKDLERHTQNILDPERARVPGVSDQDWSQEIGKSVEFMRNLRTAIARSNAGYEDMGEGDATQQKVGFIQAGLEETNPNVAQSWAKRGEAIFGAASGKSDNSEAIDRRTEQREQDSIRREKQAALRSLDSQIRSKTSEKNRAEKDLDKERAKELDDEIKALNEERRALISPSTTSQSSGATKFRSPADVALTARQRVEAAARK